MSFDWASFGAGVGAFIFVIMLIALIGSVVDAVSAAVKRRSKFTQLYLGAYGYCRDCRHGLYADSRSGVRDMFLEHCRLAHPQGFVHPDVPASP
jgi:hypothetical protein